MKKHILTLTLASALIAPLWALAQDAGGGTPPPPPQGDFGGTQQQPPPSGGTGGSSFGPQQPMDGGGGFQGGFQPQQPMNQGGQPSFRDNQPFPGGQPPKGEGQFFRSQGGFEEQGKFREGGFPPPPGQDGQFQNQPKGKGGQFPGKGATQGQFPGQGTTEGQFPGQGPFPFPNQDEGQKQFPGDRHQNQGEGQGKKMKQQPQNPFGGENEQGNMGFEDQAFEDQGGQEDFVDAREIQQVQRQINDLKKQATRLLKKTAKNAALANEASELQNFINKLASYAEAVKAGTRDALQEFYDAELWETLNGFQARIEMPTEISRVEKDLVRLEKLIAQKAFQVNGVDLGIVRSKIEEIRSAINGAKSALSSGDPESAREYLQVVYEGTHPGEMHGVLQQLREITKQLKTIKNEEIRQAIMEVLSPVYEAVAAGDFREANMALSEVSRELFSLFGRLRNTRTFNNDLRTKMRTLEQKLEGRIQEIETQGERNAQPGAFVPYKSSERGLGSIFSSVRNFFGF